MFEGRVGDKKVIMRDVLEEVVIEQLWRHVPHMELNQKIKKTLPCGDTVRKFFFFFSDFNCLSSFASRIGNAGLTLCFKEGDVCTFVYPHAHIIESFLPKKLEEVCGIVQKTSLESSFCLLRSGCQLSSRPISVGFESHQGLCETTEILHAEW